MKGVKAVILSVDEFRRYYPTDEPDDLIAGKIRAIERMIRAYTNNGFQVRNIRGEYSIINGIFVGKPGILFREGDTVQVTGSRYNDGLYTIDNVGENTFTVLEDTEKADDFGIATKVKYPPDVVMGVINLMKWDMERRDKVGIASETISRHAVTYADMTADNSVVGYPRMLISFLLPYKKARFGDA